MNRFSIVIAFSMFLCSMAEAQVLPEYKNSIRIGVDYMSLDAPDDLGFRYLVRYARHLANDRFTVEGSLGYLGTKNRHLALNNFYFEGRLRERLTADLTASFDLIRDPRYALRLGGGPSIWYRKDDVLLGARSIVDQNGQPTGIIARSKEIDEANFGYHLTAEYEFEISLRTTLSARVGFANLSGAGISSTAGVNVGYRF